MPPITEGKRGQARSKDKNFDVYFEGKQVGKFRLDLIVEDKVVVEVKALTGNIPTVFESQVLSYLKASGYTTG